MNPKDKLYKIGIYMALCVAILGGIIFYVGLDRGNLTFMMTGKETTLYVDKNNPHNNYLDLEFLQ